ncbi:hypothetical protein HII36_06605 [Nonomuraea sp. NN258]|uniref:hypothetical protein n=1 Tax=Nonomuraea antri TaxID=2730852 RepID=UPI001568BF43|nr:hypothetical protein [Nonomuraea antri]NRQ31512.1 hypothetical protein [Nonomuraea antri]
MGEPDWAGVARSLLKVLAVTAALLLAGEALDRALWLFGDDRRMVEVYGTAARVANPHERLSNGYGGSGGLLATAHRMWGEPRLAGPGGGERDHEIVLDVFGNLRAPSLGGPTGGVADALAMGHAPADQVKKVIDGLPQTLVAVAVVEFETPLTTERLVAFNAEHRICGGADVSYVYDVPFADDSSDPSSYNAIVWNRGMVLDYWEKVDHECAAEPRAALAEFRDWVGLLDEDDDLSAFGLYYGPLKQAAEHNEVHGLLVDRWRLADLRKLLDAPEVRTVHLADVAFDVSPGENEDG